MPTVLREAGFRFVVYTDDHEPEHIHAYRGHGLGAVVKVNLIDLSLIHSQGFLSSEIRRIVGIVKSRQQEFRAAWNAIHGASS